MEWLLAGLVILALIAGILVLPIVALVYAVKANRRSDRLEKRFRRWIGSTSAPPLPAEPPSAPSSPVASSPERTPAEPLPPAPPPVPVPESPPPPVSAPTPAKTPARSVAPGTSLEERIGLVWFTRIGAVIGTLVAAWFFKYMVDNEWIGPWTRVGIGVAVGGALLAWGEFLARREKTIPAVFVQGILGLGLALLLVSSFASFAFYELLPIAVTFVTVALFCVLGAFLAVRHRSEAILVLALVAVFLNPIILSTGEDRALTLFSYLLVMTGGALAVCVRFRFHLSIGLAVLGTAFLTGSWWGRFFEIASTDAAYHGLAARAIPLLFSVLFPAAWATAGLALRRVDVRYLPESLLLAASLGAHVAFPALLSDHPELLGGVLVALAAGSAALLVRVDRGTWLGVPMVAAFASLGIATPDFADRGPLLLTIVTAVVAAFYLAVFLRDAARADNRDEPAAPILCAGPGLGLIILAGVWLLPAHPTELALMVTGLAGGYALLARLLRWPGLLLGAFAASLCVMAVAGSATEGVHAGVLAASGAWFLVLAMLVAFERPGGDWMHVPRLAVLTGAGAGLVLLVLIGTEPEDERLRSVLVLAGAAVLLAIGLRERLAGDDRAERAFPPLGTAAALIAVAAAFLFRGAGPTVVWALEAAVLAALAVREKQRGVTGHPAWLAAALVLFAFAAGRLLVEDVAWNEASRSVNPSVFGRPQAWSLLALGVALLAAARSVSARRERPGFRDVLIPLVIAGHGALLWLAIGEARLAFTDFLPAEAIGATHEAYEAYIESFKAQESRLDLVTTVVLGLYAGAVLAIGFVLRSLIHRLLGIGLFAIAIAKLGLWDVWSLRTLHRIVVGASIAALLLAGGFLYARFGDRIRSLLTETDESADSPSD